MMKSLFIVASWCIVVKILVGEIILITLIVLLRYIYIVFLLTTDAIGESVHLLTTGNAVFILLCGRPFTTVATFSGDVYLTSLLTVTTISKTLFTTVPLDIAVLPLLTVVSSVKSLSEVTSWLSPKRLIASVLPLYSHDQQLVEYITQSVIRFVREPITNT